VLQTKSSTGENREPGRAWWDKEKRTVAFFVANWNNYLWPLIVTHKRSLWVIQIAIANFRGERTVAWNLVLAASCVTIVPTILIFFVFQRYLVEGIKMSGIIAFSINNGYTGLKKESGLTQAGSQERL
jgi:hypothetical protein